jgi:ferredoxin
MKVTVQNNICQGHALCFINCPEVFRLNGKDGHAYVDSADVPPGLEDQVESASLSCPEGAIVLSDE